jgi:2-dehydropantoate 2-reductase
LIDIDKKKIDKIKDHGVIIQEDNSEFIAYPNAVSDSVDICPVDLLIVFVKAMYSKDALSSNKHLIGSNTYVMTLQNGSGHEDILLEFVPEDRIIIGTTQHNSSMIAPGHVHHDGKGLTQIGLLKGDSKKLQCMADNFTSCGFKTVVSDNVKKQIWEKLLLNSSASILTAILQVKLGYILNNPHAWSLAEKLIREAVLVANAEGIEFDARFLPIFFYIISALLTLLYKTQFYPVVSLSLPVWNMLLRHIFHQLECNPFLPGQIISPSFSHLLH